MEIKKVEFNPKEDNDEYPYFAVSESVLQPFIEFLNANEVYPQPPQEILNASEAIFELALPANSDETEMKNLCEKFLRHN